MKINKWQADKYQNHAGFVSNLASPVVELLNPLKDEKILDLGCGEGALALQIQALGAKVVGIDSSREMVASACDKGVEAYVMDATNIQLNQKYDAVFSNAVLHWIKQPAEVLTEIKRVLKPNGRFIAEFGGEGNIRSLTEAMASAFNENPSFGEFENPWFFPSVDEYRRLLVAAGFDVQTIELIQRPTKIDDVANWLQVFANGIISHLGELEKQAFIADLRSRLKPDLYSEDRGWVVDYVRLRVSAKLLE